MSNTAVFLDRDGTLIHDPGYLNHPDQVQVIDGAAEAVKEFRLLGYKTIVASNQSGVARGMVTPEMVERIHDRLRELLGAKGAALDAIYYCPYHPEGIISEYRKDSDWRKPQPGMLLAAAQEMNIDLSRSWMIGDSDRDMEAGRHAGCKTILIGAPRPGESTPDYLAVNMREAVNIIKQHRHTLGDGRIPPVSQASQISDKRLPNTGSGVGDPAQRLAGKSAEILALPREPASGKPGDIPCVEGVGTPNTEDRVWELFPPSTRGPDAHDTAPAAPVQPGADLARTEQLLAGILEQLRRVQDREMFREFSFMRLLAGLVQVFVPVCLLLALWFLMGSRRQDNNVFVTLGFAAVLQLMALTFYIMHGRR